jgi:hypothetical protein
MGNKGASPEFVRQAREISDRANMRQAGYGPGGPSPRPPIQRSLWRKFLDRLFS